jgi:segregation and condensation protein A
LDYFSQQESFEEALVSFFSLLELIKSRIVIAIQKGPFQPIKVRLRQEAYLKRK